MSPHNAVTAGDNGQQQQRQQQVQTHQQQDAGQLEQSQQLHDNRTTSAHNTAATTVALASTVATGTPEADKALQQLADEQASPDLNATTIPAEAPQQQEMGNGNHNRHNNAAYTENATTAGQTMTRIQQAQQWPDPTSDFWRRQYLRHQVALLRTRVNPVHQLLCDHLMNPLDFVACLAQQLRKTKPCADHSGTPDSGYST